MFRWRGRTSEGEDLTVSLERLIWTLRTGDMIDVVKAYISILGHLASGAVQDPEDPQAKAQALDDLANHITRAAPGFAPLANSGLVISRVAKRVRSEDPILSEPGLPRILQCLIDVFDKFLSTALTRATEHCEKGGYDSIAVHAWGSLSRKCASLIAKSSRSPKVVLFGARAREIAPKLKNDIGAGVTVVPPLFSYQVAGSVDAIIFQAETVTPLSILARTGASQVLEYPGMGSDTDILSVTISLAYQPRRGALASSYRRLPSANFRLEWQEIIDLPLFDLVLIENIAGNIKIIDEKGVTSAKPAVLRRKALAIVKELEDLVEARCRVYEPS